MCRRSRRRGRLFEYMAELSHGAYCPFGTGSAAAMRELLSTVAAFSTAGIEGVKQVQKEVMSADVSGGIKGSHFRRVRGVPGAA